MMFRLLPPERLTGRTRHVARRTDVFAATLKPRGKRTDSAGAQTLPAGPDPVSTLADTDLVLVWCSVRTNTQSRASDTWPRARHAVLVTILSALLTTTVVIGRVLTVLERAYEPFLPLAHILAVRALEFELRFLDKSSVYTLCFGMRDHLPG